MKENRLNYLYFCNNINPYSPKLVLKNEKIINNNSKYGNLNNYKLENVIGKGGFGKVRCNCKY